MTANAWLCVVLFVIFGLAALIVNRIQARAQRRRYGRLRRWAGANGWTVVESPQVNWPDRLPGAELGSGKVTLLLSGTVEGRSVAVGEYEHTYPEPGASGDRYTTDSYIVAGVWLDRQYAPFSLYETNLGEKVLRSIVGRSGVPLGYAPFDRKYRIVAADPVDIPRYLTPPLVADHVSGVAPLWSLQDSELIVYRPGTIDDPSRIPKAATEAIRMAQLLRVP
jgi:hypothetical protein